ncbi:MAG TPA: ribosome maturation factor RimP [Roseiarcus sp.]|nr:ribosome maturation factor RimP [Roseiarcus sp.]
MRSFESGPRGTRSFLLPHGHMVEAQHFPAAKPQDGLDEPRLMDDAGPALHIGRIAAPVLKDLGLRLVRVKISAAAGTTVQVMAERPDGTMTIDDCERASDALSPVFDAEDILTQSYRLEVSSPGIDRPLVRESDFRRAVGHEARFEMAAAIGGRKRFRGRLDGVAAGPQGPEAVVRVVADDKTEASVVLPLRGMSEARLVLTEDLIRALLRREKAAQRQARKAPRQTANKKNSARNGALSAPGPEEGEEDGR